MVCQMFIIVVEKMAGKTLQKYDISFEGTKYSCIFAL